METKGSRGASRQQYPLKTQTTPFIFVGYRLKRMLDKLGPLGIAGLAIVLVGIALIAYANLIIAAGMALVLIGLALTVKALVSGMLGAFGMM